MQYHVPFFNEWKDTDLSLSPEGSAINRKEQHFRICNLEQAITVFDPAFSLQTTPAYELVLIRSGTGILSIDLNEYEIPGGNVYGLSPGCSRYIKDAAGIEGYYITFSRDFCQRCYLQAIFPALGLGGIIGSEPVVIAANEESLQDLEAISQKMFKEYSGNNNMRAEILQGLFQVLITYISRIFSKPLPAASGNKEIVISGAFMDLLHQYIKVHKQVSDYAAMLFVTPGYLNKVVKRATGFTASYHIQQQLLLEAKRKAVYSRDSMKEIASQLGFVDLYHFSKFFKRNSGVNFTTFRRDFNIA